MLNRLTCMFKGHKFITHYDLKRMAYHVKGTDCCSRCNQTREPQKQKISMRELRA